MSGRTILLVEDNPGDEKLTLRALAKNGFRDIIVTRDGAEAVDYLSSTGAFASRVGAAPPALVLLDLKLPKLDGLEVLRRLRANERTRRVPVVMLTSSNQEQELLKSYNHGANGYIRKPVDFNQFMETVRLLGHYWLTVNEPPPS